jgi:hypothetical protein
VHETCHSVIACSEVFCIVSSMICHAALRGVRRQGRHIPMIT